MTTCLFPGARGALCLDRYVAAKCDYTHEEFPAMSAYKETQTEVHQEMGWKNRETSM